MQRQMAVIIDTFFPLLIDCIHCISIPDDANAHCTPNCSAFKLIFHSNGIWQVIFFLSLKFKLKLIAIRIAHIFNWNLIATKMSGENENDFSNQILHFSHHRMQFKVLNCLKNLEVFANEHMNLNNFVRK